MSTAVVTAAPHTMQCMEVWGGTGESDNGVTMPGLDAWVFSRPYQGQAAGGDIHYLSSCSTGRISRMLVADVAGHGDTVAALAKDLRTLMRRYINYVDQSRFVSLMNTEFGKVSDGGRFATAVVATFFAPTSTLVLCNAAHPRPLAFSAKRKQWYVLEARTLGGRARAAEQAGGANLPLGIVDDEQYEQFQARTRPGDMVVIYSDSLVEARDERGAFLGEEGLLAIARTLDTAQPVTLARALYDGVRAFTGGKPPDDDVTIMVLRPNGQGTQRGFGSKLWGQVRFVGMAIRHAVDKRMTVPWPEPSVANIIGAVVPGAAKRVGRGAREL